MKNPFQRNKLEHKKTQDNQHRKTLTKIINMLQILKFY